MQPCRRNGKHVGRRLGARYVHVWGAFDLGLWPAHRLAKEYPERAVSWFGIGCYYMCIGRHTDARRYFGKATALDPAFSPAWLGFGHAFAAQDESDQVGRAPPGMCKSLEQQGCTGRRKRRRTTKAGLAG